MLFSYILSCNSELRVFSNAGYKLYIILIFLINHLAARESILL